MKAFRYPSLPVKDGRKRRVELVPPVPGPFEFGFSALRPLVPLPAAVLFLNRNAKHVLKLIEEGGLRWAFDLRSPKTEHRQVRILRQSLLEYAGIVERPDEDEQLPEEVELLRAVNLILPKGVVVTPRSFQTTPRGTMRLGGNFHLKLRLAAPEFHKLHFPAEPVLRATELSQCFSCNGQHVLNLIKSGALQAVNLRRGPKASPLVTRASAVEFLKQRRIS